VLVVRRRFVISHDLPGDRASDRKAAVTLAFTLIFYVALGVSGKTFVLNWIIGPLFPFIVLYVIPRTYRRVTRGPQ
jgi:hypothetical protein